MAETELERDQAKHILTFVYGAYKSILDATDDKNVSSSDIDELLKLNKSVRDKLLAIRDKKHNI
jgi:hypothetical protein